MDDNNLQTDKNLSSDISLDQLQKDLDSAMNGWKRAQADFENFKKQKERENKELAEFAKEVAVVKLLPTLDTLGQALKHSPQYTVDSNQSLEFGKQYENWQIGISGILQQLDKVLEELGVKKIEAVGKKFDPHFHEAIREVGSEKEDGVILDEMQSGYILNGKVIRPSQVIISKKTTEVAYK